MVANYPPKRLLITAIVVTTLTYFPIGYHHSVLNVAHDIFERLINVSYTEHYGSTPSDTTRSALWSISVSSWQVGAALASFNAFWIVERYGRKMTLLVISSVLQLVGSLTMAAAIPAGCFELIIAGRFACGISAGLVCPTLRIFLSECSPDCHRGTLNSIAGFVMFIGALAAMGLGLPECFGTNEMSPFLCVFCSIFALATLCVFPLFPSTPKYLYLTEQRSTEAAASLKFYFGSNVNVKRVFDELDREGGLTNDEMSLKEALLTKSIRLPLLLSATAGLAFSCTGMDIFDSYSTEIFEYLGLSTHKSQLASSLFNVPGVVGAILALVIVERISRRKLVLVTLTGCFVATSFLIVTGLVPTSVMPGEALGITAAVLVAVLTFFFSLGPNAVLESLFSEVAPHKIRTVAGTVSEVAFWVSDTLFVFLFPLALRVFGYYSFLMFVVPLGLCIIYFYLYLPNCSGKSAYEISQKINLGKTESTIKMLDDSSSVEKI